MDLAGKATNFGMWNSLRKKAVSEWDGITYKRACDNLGLEPEFPDLYSRGEAEEMHLHTKMTRSLSPSKYDSFYKEAVVFNENDFCSHAYEKKTLLQKYFPKFRKDGKQSLSDEEDMRVGCIFREMVKYAKRVIN